MRRLVAQPHTHAEGSRGHPFCGLPARGCAHIPLRTRTTPSPRLARRTVLRAGPAAPLLAPRRPLSSHSATASRSEPHCTARSSRSPELQVARARILYYGIVYYNVICIKQYTLLHLHLLYPYRCIIYRYTICSWVGRRGADTCRVFERNGSAQVADQTIYSEYEFGISWWGIPDLELHAYPLFIAMVVCGNGFGSFVYIVFSKMYPDSCVLFCVHSIHDRARTCPETFR